MLKKLLATYASDKRISVSTLGSYFENAQRAHSPQLAAGLASEY